MTHISDVHENQEVTIMSEDLLSPISLEHQAERVGMITYDMLVHMNKEMYRTTIKKK